MIQYIRKLSMPRRIVAAGDWGGEFYPLNNYSYVVTRDAKQDLHWVLAVLNSRLINWYFANSFIDYNIKPAYLQKLPIRIPEGTGMTELANLVDAIEEERRARAEARSPQASQHHDYAVSALDRRIDRLVYDLYGLTDDEIALVEESTSSP